LRIIRSEKVVASNMVFVDAAKVFGYGKIHVPKSVRDLLKVVDEDKIVFYRDHEGKIFVEGAPKPGRKRVGKYT